MPDITGRADLYKENVTNMQDKIDMQIARQDDSHPTILFLRSYASGVSAKASDSMAGAMLKELGCTNIADSDSFLTGELSIENITTTDPDYKNTSY